VRTYPAYRIEVHTSFQGQTQMNILHYSKGSTNLGVVWPTVSDIAERTTDALTDIDSVASIVPGGFRWEKVVVMDQRTEEGEISTSSIGLSPSVSENSALAAACAVAEYRTGSRGLAGRGRTFWGPLKESLVAADGRSIANYAAVAAKVQRFVDLMDDSGVIVPQSTGGLCVVSLPPRGVNGSTPAAVVRQIKSCQLSPVVGIQRRRMRG